MIKCLSEDEVMTLVAIFCKLGKMPFEKLNTFFGSLTVEKMLRLWSELNDWYQTEVLPKEYNEETEQHED